MADNKTLYVIDLRDNFSPKVDKADKKFNKFDKNVKQSTKKTGGVGGLAAAFPMASLGLAGLAAGALVGAKKILDLGAAMEQTRVAFSVMFGSADKGNEMLDLMNEFANVTPFTNDQVIQAGKTLKAFEFEAAAIAPTMKILGDVAAGTGSNIGDLATIFGRIKGNTRIQGEELNQLIDRGFNPLNFIAKKTGKSMAVLRKEMSKGQISFDMIQESFVAATSKGGQFENMMAKQSETFTGLTSTIKGKLGALFAEGGEGLAGVLKPLLKWTISFIDMLPKINLDPLINAFSLWWKTTKDLLSPLTDLFGGLGEGIELIDVFQGAINGLAAGLRALTLPIRIVEAAFNGLMKFLDNAMIGFEGVGLVFEGLFNRDFATIARGVTNFKKGFGQIAENVGSFVDSEIEEFKKIFNAKANTEGSGIDLAGAMDLSKLTGAGGGGASGTGGTGTAGKKASVSGNVAGVSSGGIKNVTLNIDKLVEQITFSNTTTDNLTELEDMVARVLVRASTDATRLI
jgi:tape measure domain-containing protein